MSRVSTQPVFRAVCALVRAEARVRYGSEDYCEGCRRVRRGTVVHHVIPASVAPEIRLEKTNHRILCRPCKQAKDSENLLSWGRR